MSYQSFTTLPPKMEIHKFNRLLEEQQQMYNTSIIKVKVDPELGDIQYYEKLSQVDYDHKIALRMHKEQENQITLQQRHDIIRTTLGIEITEAEYNALPRDKYGFNWVPKYSGCPWNLDTSYVKGQSLRDIEKEKQTRLEQIRTTPGIEITEAEYNALPYGKYGFNWIEKGNGCQREYYSSYVKGQSLRDIEKEKQTRLEQIRTTPGIEIHFLEFESLKPDILRFNWFNTTKGHPKDCEYIYIKK